MIEANKRKVIFNLHEFGMTIRDIAKRFAVSRNTIRAVIAQRGEVPLIAAKPKVDIDKELLQALYAECEGKIQRMHEKLTEEMQIDIKYSSLTRRLRKLQISNRPQPRCARVPDEPGVEMQHDTTVYQIKLSGDKKVRLVASLLYLRYSKRRYLKFYTCFNRFKMKCFIHEALMFWGYTAQDCIIDNTNLARLGGTGKNAVIHPEMEAFSKQYGFKFRCHALNHPNRKAGEERSFWTVETNFLKGRTFNDLTDLNKQAFDWATVRMENRAQGKAGLIPAIAFEHESSYLTKLPQLLSAPYKIHERIVDQYGYIAFGGNYYWVPGKDRGQVTVLEYSTKLTIYRERNFLWEYSLPSDDTKNKLLSPAELPAPEKQPNDRKHSSEHEERKLREIDEVISRYLDFVLQNGHPRRHIFMRGLWKISRRMTPTLFIKTVQRALNYRITDLDTITRIASLYLNQGTEIATLAELDEAFVDRESYKAGAFTDSPDISIYESLDEKLEEDEDE